MPRLTLSSIKTRWHAWLLRRERRYWRKLLTITDRPSRFPKVADTRDTTGTFRRITSRN